MGRQPHGPAGGIRLTLRPILLAALLLASPAAALVPVGEEIDALSEIQDSAVSGPIGIIRAPLLARPAFAPPGGAFDVETRGGVSSNGFWLWLEEGTTRCDLAIVSHRTGHSLAWPEDNYASFEHRRVMVPADCPPGLYDLHSLGYGYGHTSSSDAQPNAVSVVEPARWDALASGAAHPRIVVIADPQIGDPRALAQAAEEDPARIPIVLDGILGDGSEGIDGRWRAVRHAFARAKAADPDFVVLAGDLGFGQLVPGSYEAEYREIHRILREAEVPLFAAPGNHDGYVASGVDGFAYWRAYVGPTYTLAPTLPGTYLLVMNSYDWSELDRVGLSYGVSSWGGQVREKQMGWIGFATAKVRAQDPDARILAVSHHSPSWRQDPFEPMANGILVAEQVERGAITYTSTDQGWMGEGRLALRDLLRERGVEIAFAGHTHHDRVARDDGTGRIVGTTQTVAVMPEGFDPTLLHLWTRDDAIVPGLDQDALAGMLRASTGPLYLDTTTPMSDGDEYWGYRVAQLAYDAHGDLELAQLGYPMTQEELDLIALHPERYNVAHAALGLFSTPLVLDPVEPWASLG